MVPVCNVAGHYPTGIWVSFYKTANPHFNQYSRAIDAQGGSDMVSFDDFKKIDLRIGEVLTVEHVPNADKLYALQVDVGGKQIQLVAGLREAYKEDELKGKRIVVVTNLDPVKIRGITSEGMLLAAVDGKEVSLLTVDRPVSVGSGVA